MRSHPDCLLHVPPLGHPDTPVRLRVLLDELERAPAGWSVDREAPLPPEDDIVGVLKWVHSEEHLNRVRASSGRAPTWLDSHDCAVSEGTWAAVVASAGLALQAALDLVNERVARVFLAVRPPSHHAERNRARGFCFVNSAALAAEVVVRSWGRPVLVVDLDARHGNGTQQQFWSHPAVGLVSVHGWSGFPETGGADEVGADGGRGIIRNVPLADGADDDVFCDALESALDDVGRRLRPAAVVVSAGFNGHRDDPTGHLRLGPEAYRRATRAVVAVAERFGDGRVMSLLEGGYHPPGTAACARAHVEALAATPALRSGADVDETVH